jgi:hypothetical protein
MLALLLGIWCELFALLQGSLDKSACGTSAYFATVSFVSEMGWVSSGVHLVCWCQFHILFEPLRSDLLNISLNVAQGSPNFTEPAQTNSSNPFHAASQATFQQQVIKCSLFSKHILLFKFSMTRSVWLLNA